MASFENTRTALSVVQEHAISSSLSSDLPTAATLFMSHRPTSCQYATEDKQQVSCVFCSVSKKRTYTGYCYRKVSKIDYCRREVSKWVTSSRLLTLSQAWEVFLSFAGMTNKKTLNLFTAHKSGFTGLASTFLGHRCYISVQFWHIESTLYVDGYTSDFKHSNRWSTILRLLEAYFLVQSNCDVLSSDVRRTINTHT